MLWQAGFCDADVPKAAGRTSLVMFASSKGYVKYDLIANVEITNWLVQKGAKFHQMQYHTIDADLNEALETMESQPVIRAVHYVGTRIGRSAGSRYRNYIVDRWYCSPPSWHDIPNPELGYPWRITYLPSAGDIYE